MSFEPMNRMAEESAGLVKKRTEAEKIAEEKAQALYALKGMEQMSPRPAEAVFQQTRDWYNDADAKLKKLEKEGHDVAKAWKKAVDAQERQQLENLSIARAWKDLHPDQNVMEFGGAESQMLYEKFAATPNYSGDGRVDLHTCSYCHKISMEELKFCARCKKVVYCNRACQKNAWKAHKKICNKSDTDKVKSARLTWDQLEALEGEPATGQTLEVRAMLDESITRQVFRCKDRNGVVRRVAAYTNNGRIQGLVPGAVLQWKNPRFHYFMDGSSGARIEEEDLVNIKISDK